MDALVADLQTEIDQVAWYHEFDFGNGLVAQPKTPDAASHRRLWRFIERELQRIDFTGKTVLDIGCWDGYWSFYAERRGAAQVLATDDRSQNWAGDSGLRLASRLLKSSVEIDTDVSIYELDKLGQQFDIILCPGVYYHLLDPFYAFAQIRHRCKPDSIIVFEGDAFYPVSAPGMRPSEPAAYISPDATRARFVPEPNALRHMLHMNYFTIEREAKHLLADKVTGTHRILMHCCPFFGASEAHAYPPPFGLRKYDPRWR